MTDSDLEIYGRLTDDFESAWSAWSARPDDPPDPADYLPSPPIEPLSGLVLLQNLKVDLEYRSSKGGLPSPEELLGRFPALRADPESLVELLAWGSRLDDSTSNGGRSGFDMPSLAAKFPEVKDEVVRCRATLYRELDGKLSTDLIPDGYSLIRELKPGGMSRVALVRNRSNGREEVLKLNDPLSSDRPEAVRRFEDEIQIAGRLTGQVVPVYQSGSLGGHLYYTMPYLKGGSLRDRLDAGEVPLREGVALLRDICRAVEKLHAYRTDDRATPIVHRDLKPANILFGDPGNSDPRISDLGLAKLLDETADPDAPRSLTGQSLGTPGYMAPEQIFGVPGEVGPPADIHALGAMLYEILTGHRPFEAPTVHATLIRTLHEDPAPPREVAPDRAPLNLGAVALKALKKVPAARYTSAAALADDLDRWLEGKPVLAREAGFGERLASVARRHPVASRVAVGFVAAIAILSVVSTTLLVRVSQQKARADRNALKRAASLGGLMDRVSETLAKAGLSKQRSDILGTIAADLHEVVVENDGIGSVEFGNALLQEATALLLLGKPKESLEASERAGAVFAAIPESFEAEAGQGAALQQGGRILAALGRFDEGLDRTKRAIAIYRPLVEQRPDDAEVRFRLARMLINLGNFLGRLGPANAEAPDLEALEQLAILRRASHDAPLHVEWDARTRSNLGLVLSALDRNDQAIAAQVEATTLANRLVAAFPDEILLLDVQAATQNNLGDALERAGRLDEAEAALQAAIIPYRRLAARFPEETEFHWGVALVQTNLAAIQNRRQKWDESIPLLVDAGTALEALLKVIPDDTELRTNVALQQKLLAEARAAVSSRAVKPVSSK